VAVAVVEIIEVAVVVQEDLIIIVPLRLLKEPEYLTP
jgi:hypothetical protein